jgi:hypothetical protein
MAAAVGEATMAQRHSDKTMALSASLRVRPEDLADRLRSLQGSDSLAMLSRTLMARTSIYCSTFWLSKYLRAHPAAPTGTTKAS